MSLIMAEPKIIFQLVIENVHASVQIINDGIS